MIEKDDIRRLASLARLSLSPEEEERFTHESQAILAYIGKLGELDLEGVIPMTHAHDVANVFALDAVHESTEREHERLVAQFPDEKDGYLRVKNVFE